MKPKQMFRCGTEYAALKNRYFEWLETSEEPLNLRDYALQYEFILLQG